MLARRTTVATLRLAAGLIATPAWADFRFNARSRSNPGGTFVRESDFGDVGLTGDWRPAPERAW